MHPFAQMVVPLALPLSEHCFGPERRKTQLNMISNKLRRKPITLGLSMGVLAVLALLGACDSSNTGAGNSCPVGEKRCACFSNDTCNDGLVCLSDVCVEAGAGGSGTTPATTTANTSTQPQGTGGSANTATVANVGGSGNDTAQTSSSGGNDNPATTAGNNGGAAQTSVPANSSTPASGGATLTSDTTGSSTPASGGTGNLATTTAVSTGGTTQATASTTSAVNNSPIIDAFVTCDDQIENNGGRSGKWYYFADEEVRALKTHRAAR